MRVLLSSRSRAGRVAAGIALGAAASGASAAWDEMGRECSGERGLRDVVKGVAFDVMALAFTCPGCGRWTVLLFRAEGDPATCRECGQTTTVPSGAEDIRDPFGLVRLAPWMRLFAKSLFVLALVVIVGAVGRGTLEWLASDDRSETFVIPHTEHWPTDSELRSQRLWQICDRVHERVGYATVFPTEDEEGRPAILYAGERLERWRIEAALRDVTSDD